MATFDSGNYSESWGRAYGLWDKSKDLLLVYLLFKQYKKIWKPLLIFAGIRLVWDCISWWSGVAINNNIAVGILFLIYISYVSYKTLHNVRN